MSILFVKLFVIAVVGWNTAQAIRVVNDDWKRGRYASMIGIATLQTAVIILVAMMFMVT